MEFPHLVGRLNITIKMTQLKSTGFLNLLYKNDKICMQIRPNSHKFSSEKNCISKSVCISNGATLYLTWSSLCCTYFLCRLLFKIQSIFDCEFVIINPNFDNIYFVFK